MPEDWNRAEVAATVAEYFAMLGAELRGESFSKKQHNRQLQTMLNGRSAGAIEFKHANISAVLIELGFPYIDGYKPRGNYQDLLRDEVMARLDGAGSLKSVAQEIVDATVVALSLSPHQHDVFVSAPIREPGRSRVQERRVTPTGPRRNINYLERESKNASLGLAGELFAFEAEQQRLWQLGHKKLAERVDHVSRSQGDGLGYDIVSFETSGRERFIEVKTTNFGALTPFFASQREVAVSEERATGYHLYRVFGFRRAPKVFVLPGSLRQSCVLDPIQYRASLS
jgi:hypothetical protein